MAMISRVIAAFLFIALAGPAMADDCCQYRATVLGCYDADTCTLDVYLGLGVSVEQRVRLARIDAWELRGPERQQGLIARDWLRDRIVGREVVIETNHDQTGKYGRLIAEILIDGENVSDALVDAGHAAYY